MRTVSRMSLVLAVGSRVLSDADPTGVGGTGRLLLHQVEEARELTIDNTDTPGGW